MLRFLSELEDNIEHFTTKIVNFMDSLVRSINKITEDDRKAEERLKTLMQQNNSSKDEIKEASRVERQKMEEYKRRYEKNIEEGKSHNEFELHLNNSPTKCINKLSKYMQTKSCRPFLKSFNKLLICKTIYCNN